MLNWKKLVAVTSLPMESQNPGTTLVVFASLLVVRAASHWCNLWANLTSYICMIQVTLLFYIIPVWALVFPLVKCPFDVRVVYDGFGLCITHLTFRLMYWIGWPVELFLLLNHAWFSYFYPLDRFFPTAFFTVGTFIEPSVYLLLWIEFG